MLGKQQIELEDKVYRAFGVLANAKKISSEECNKLLSDVKLGTDLGVIKELNDLKIRKLETYTKPANLQKIPHPRPNPRKVQRQCVRHFSLA